MVVDALDGEVGPPHIPHFEAVLEDRHEMVLLDWVEVYLSNIEVVDVFDHALFPFGLLVDYLDLPLLVGGAKNQIVVNDVYCSKINGVLESKDVCLGVFLDVQLE